MTTIMLRRHLKNGPQIFVSQEIKRGKHGRFTKFITKKQWIDGIINFVLGVFVTVVLLASGFFLGLQHGLQAAVVSPMP